MTESTQLSTQEDRAIDLVAHYQDSTHNAMHLLERAVVDAGNDFRALTTNLRAVNEYCKACCSVADLAQRSIGSVDESTVWDPFASESLLDTKLQVIQAKAEFTAITSGESSAVALYQAGLTYRDISHHTGISKKELQRLFKAQGASRGAKKKKSVPVVTV